MKLLEQQLEIEALKSKLKEEEEKIALQEKEITQKNKTMRASIVCAIRGIKLGFESEKNYKYYGMIALVTLILNILLKVSCMEYCLFILLTIGVFAMESVNTAIEFLANRVSAVYDEEIGKAKDIAAGAVLLSGCSFIIIEGVILISKL